MITHEHALKIGITLNNYTIIKILGAGGFGITYLARDTQLGMEVVIKEYFPGDLAIRKDDSTIISKSSNTKNDFLKGMQRFKEEAQILAKFNHPSIVKILNYFESNNTAYFVMEYEEGIDLSQYIKQKGTPLGEEEILSIMIPILEGLKEVHAHNYLHRDIKPGNILIRKTKPPVLIDFGASKLAIGEMSRSITSVLTEGYAPLEQYSANVKQQGPFSDLYSVGAVIYKMITGEVPPSAQTRSYEVLQEGVDPYKKLVEMNLNGYNESFLNAVDRILSIKAKDRSQNVLEFQKDIVGELIRKESIPLEDLEKISSSNSKYLWVLFVIVFAIVFGWYLKEQNKVPVQEMPTTIMVKQTDGTKTTQKNNENKKKKLREEERLEKARLKKEEEARKKQLELEQGKKKQRAKELEQLKKYKEVCNNGDKVACKKEAEYYQEKCDEDNARQCQNLGWMYEYGKGMEKNLEKALELNKKSCRIGNDEACINLQKLQEKIDKKYLFGTSGIKGIAQLGKSMKTIVVPPEFRFRESISKEFAEGDYYEFNTLFILEDNKILVEIKEWDNMINEILIFSNLFVTKEGAKVGMNLSDLLKMYPQSKISRTIVEEYERFFVQIGKNMQFELDKTDYIGKPLSYVSMMNINPKNMKSSTVIKSIRLYNILDNPSNMGEKSDGIKMSEAFSNSAKRDFPYVCYGTKTYLSNGKNKYTDCIRANAPCNRFQKAHFGQYPNDKKAHEAYIRCERSGL